MLRVNKELSKYGYELSIEGFYESNSYFILVKSSNMYTLYVVNGSVVFDEIISDFINSIKHNIPFKYIITKYSLRVQYGVATTKVINHKFNEVSKKYTTCKYSYFPKDRIELKKLIKKLIVLRGNTCSLNDIDVSKITYMNDLFEVTNFNGDISEWDVSNVTNMNSMFYNSLFNGDISNWNISKVIYMDNMFYNSPLEKNPPTWYKT